MEVNYDNGYYDAQYASTKSLVLRWRLKVTTQSSWWRHVGSWCQVCGLPTEKAQEPTENNTHGTSYCPLSTKCRCILPGSIDSGTTASSRYPKATPCISMHSLYTICWCTGSQYSVCCATVMWSRGRKSSLCTPFKNVGNTAFQTTAAMSVS